jgi:large subunit ribosomal protein L1
MDTIVRAKPSSAKGQYVRNIAISSTMSPSVPIDVNLFRVT